MWLAHSYDVSVRSSWYLPVRLSVHPSFRPLLCFGSVVIPWRYYPLRSLLWRVKSLFRSPWGWILHTDRFTLLNDLYSLFFFCRTTSSKSDLVVLYHRCSHPLCHTHRPTVPFNIRPKPVHSKLQRTLCLYLDSTFVILFRILNGPGGYYWYTIVRR